MGIGKRLGQRARHTVTIGDLEFQIRPVRSRDLVENGLGQLVAVQAQRKATPREEQRAKLDKRDRDALVALRAAEVKGELSGDDAAELARLSKKSDEDALSSLLEAAPMLPKMAENREAMVCASVVAARSLVNDPETGEEWTPEQVAEHVGGPPWAPLQVLPAGTEPTNDDQVCVTDLGHGIINRLAAEAEALSKGGAARTLASFRRTA